MSLHLGQVIDFQRYVEEFGRNQMFGGIRPVTSRNEIVLVASPTISEIPYGWSDSNDEYLFFGSGRIGDQRENQWQNSRLINSTQDNGATLHFFESCYRKRGRSNVRYHYHGKVKLEGHQSEIQPTENNRLVLLFTLKLLNEKHNISEEFRNRIRENENELRERNRSSM